MNYQIWFLQPQYMRSVVPQHRTDSFHLIRGRLCSRQSIQVIVSYLLPLVLDVLPLVLLTALLLQTLGISYLTVLDLVLLVKSSNCGGLLMGLYFHYSIVYRLLTSRITTCLRRMLVPQFLSKLIVLIVILCGITLRVLRQIGITKSRAVILPITIGQVALLTRVLMLVGLAKLPNRVMVSLFYMTRMVVGRTFHSVYGAFSYAHRLLIS